MAKTSKSDIQAWIGEKLKSQGRSALIAGVCLLALGAFILFIQFWLLWVFFWIVTMSFGGLTFWPLAVLALIATGLLFVGNKFTSSDDLQGWEPQLGANRTVPLLKLREAGYGALNLFSSFEDAPAIVKFVTMPLFMGPRVFVAGLGMLRQGKALKEFDQEACGRVLNALIRAGKRISFLQIGEKFGKLDLETIVPQLMLLDGVVLLRSEPAGLTIAPSLMDEFNEWLEKKVEAED